jgi:hypothetical protein
MPHRCVLPESMPESMPGREHAIARLRPAHGANFAMPAAQQQYNASRRCTSREQDLAPVARSTRPKATSFCHSRNGNCTLGKGAQPMFHRAVMGSHFSTACLPARTAELDRATTRPLLCLAPRGSGSHRRRSGGDAVSYQCQLARRSTGNGREMQTTFTRARRNRWCCDRGIRGARMRTTPSAVIADLAA